jgi:flagellar motor switch protein FliN/FliY
MESTNVTQNPDTQLDELLGSMNNHSESPMAETEIVKPKAPRLGLGSLMRKIPVTLTLELGSTRLSLEDLAHLTTDSVVELDALAGEPLVIKVNGVPIGKAEVVVSGENYGLKVLEISDLNLDSLAA